MLKALRIAGFAVGGIIALLAVAYGTVVVKSNRAFAREWDVNPPPLQLTEMAGTNGHLAARGEHLAHVRGCLDCHSADGGGTAFSSDPAMGLLWSKNLTSGEGGAAATFTDQDWDRAVRHGVRPDGKPLMFMPAQEFWAMSDDDLAALIAFFRTTTPVDRETPAPEIGPLGRILYVTGQLPLVPAELIDHDATRPPAPPMGPTVAYGGYLAIGCQGCHGHGYSGGKIVGGDPSWPPSRNITPDTVTGIGLWSLDDFKTALRTGVRPDGVQLDPVMPIQATKYFDDVELEAIYNYLMSLEPRPEGNH